MNITISPYRLRARLLLLALLVAVPFAAYVAYTAIERRSDAERLAQKDATMVATEIAARHAEMILLARQILAGLSKVPQIQGTRSPDACNAFVSELHRLHPRLSLIGTFLPSGDLFCVSVQPEQPVNVRDRPYFRQAIASRDFAIGDYSTGRIRGNLALPLAYPVVGKDLKIVAVVFTAIDISWINEVMARAALPEGTVLSLVNKEGTILAGYPATPQHAVAGKTVVDLDRLKATMAKGGEGVSRALGLDGVERVFVSVPFHVGVSGATYLRIGIPTRQIYAAADRDFLRDTLFAALWTLILCIALWFGSEVLVLAPIDALKVAAARLKEGDFGARTGVGNHSGELAELTATFDAMAAELEIRDGKLKRIQRTLRMLSASNRALLRAEEEDELLREMCRIAVEIGGYRLAWVGLAGQDERKSIIPVAQYGHDDGYVEKLDLVWADSAQGRDPVGAAVDTHRPCVVREDTTDPAFAPWLHAAAASGYRSSIALPLRTNGTILGTLALYSAESDAFAEDEVEVLSEIAQDLGFGIGVMRLRSEHARAEEDLHRAEQRASLHVEHTPLAVIECNSDWRIVSWNAAAERIFGYAKAQALGQHLHFIVPESARAQVDGVWTALREGRGHERSTIHNATRDGRTIVCDWYNTLLFDVGGKFLGTASLVQDVTEKLQSEQTIRRLAYFDPLTELPNRTQLFERLEQSLEQARSKNQSLALLVVNIDRFRDIQDSLGPHNADRTLQVVGTRLQRSLNGGALLARLDGDEFAIVHAGSHADDAVKLAKELDHAFDEPVEVAGIRLDVTASVGIAIFPGHARTPAALYQYAERAVIQAKRAMSGFAIASADPEDILPQRIALIRELREAIDGDQLELHYQPEIDIASGGVCAAEALVRWRHPSRGLLLPAQFIGLAEHTGLVKPLTYRVLEAAARQCYAWTEQGFDVPVAVNLSAHNLRDPELIPTVELLFSTWGVEARKLRIEITETSLMEDTARSMEVLTRLKQFGMRIYIDDFGTGYSSLGSLAVLPLDFLKIDKSFIDKLAAGAVHRHIVAMTITMAHSLNLKVVGEGVETREQAEILRGLGCDQLQGFLFSTALPPEEFRAVVSSGKLPRPGPDRPPKNGDAIRIVR